MKFYKGKRVFVTGHTGFKGTWMCQMLLMAGAEVTGYALEPPTNPSLFDLCNLQSKIHSIKGDIRDLEHLKRATMEVKPEIVIHMAAQPIVRDSYKNPVYTYETNVMGTVNILEAVRHCNSVKSFVNVTTDKVYFNKEWVWGYREDEELNGYDPYSSSKSCSELITDCYRNSFFEKGGTAISTCRAGNVIGGGDFANDRIIPDCIRAILKGEDIVVRNPFSIRPYQHVLEPVVAYLMVAQAQYEDDSVAGCYNVGPNDVDCWTTDKLVNLFCDEWNKINGTKLIWKSISDDGPHEANFLKLDCSKIRAIIGWKPRWDVNKAIEMIARWTKEYVDGRPIDVCVAKQVEEFLEG